MKYLIILFCLSFGFFVKGNAQLKPSYGIKAAINYSNFSLNDASKVHLGAGASLGGMLRLTPAKNHWWFLQLDGIYYKKASQATLISKDNGANIEVQYKYSGIVFPLYFCVNANLGNSDLSFGVGPYWSWFKMKDSQATQNGYYLMTDDTQLRSWDSGVAAIFAYDFLKHWQLNAGLRMGLVDLTYTSGRTMYNTVTYFGLAYRF